ncbi:MAG TPA: hypothetical protein VEJ37_08755 [Xanthobacteraceae bacterium]|nr:hypothetical protein [Xanthobacteraceae bacterium]
MRTMLKFTVPVERGNAAISDGMIAKTLETIVTQLKPEAAYFGPTDGKRGGIVVFKSHRALANHRSDRAAVPQLERHH